REGRLEAILEKIQCLRHERQWDVDRREQPDAVVVEAGREQDEAFLESGELDGPRELHVRLFRPAVLHKLERPHRADPTHLAHAIVAFEDLVQSFSDERLELLRLWEGLLNHIDRFERRGADDRIPAERPAEAPGAW